MATVYDLLNAEQSEVVEGRVIRAPGAAVGDVLTVSADQTVSPAPGGGSSAVLVATAYVAHADIITLPSSPIELAAAPGAGKMIVPSSALIYADTSAAPYSNISEGDELGPCTTAPGDFLNFLWESSSGSKVSTFLGGAIQIATFGPQAVEESVFGTGSVLPYITSAESLPDTPLILKSGNGTDYEEGDPANFMVVTVTYSILDLAP